MLKYAVLILWRKKGVPANFYAFCISVPVISPPLSNGAEYLIIKHVQSEEVYVLWATRFGGYKNSTIESQPVEIN